MYAGPVGRSTGLQSAGRALSLAQSAATTASSGLQYAAACYAGAQPARGLPAGTACREVGVMTLRRKLSAEEQTKMGESGLRYFEAHFDFSSLVAELKDHFKATRGVWERNKAI